MVTAVTGTADRSATARRVRNREFVSSQFVEMNTVVCEQCGEQFRITHRFPLQDEALASRQAAWLADHFVWDHIQENKHRSSIDLPEVVANAKRA